MSRRSETWNDIETLLDEVRVEEEVHLAVLEALGELDDREADEFSWDEFPLDEHPWGGFSKNAISLDYVSLEKLAEEGGFAA